MFAADFDYKNGVDTKECLDLNGDLTLVRGKLTPATCIALSASCYLAGLLTVLPALVLHWDSFVLVFLLGIALSVAYTANPVGLKYLALGVPRHRSTHLVIA